MRVFRQFHGEVRRMLHKAKFSLAPPRSARAAEGMLIAESA
jgi:hypothetical protein